MQPLVSFDLPSLYPSSFRRNDILYLFPPRIASSPGGPPEKTIGSKMCDREGAVAPFIVVLRRVQRFSLEMCDLNNNITIT